MISGSTAAAQLKRPWVLMVVAFALAAGVAFLAYTYLQKREARIKEEAVAKNVKSATPRIAVAVPIADAPIGTVLNTSKFSAREVEEDMVYPDTVLARDFEAMSGQKLAKPVLRGRPLRLTDLQAPEIKDVASVLPHGTRALTIDIDNVNSIAQTLRPGHFVDIFLISKALKARDSDTPDEALQQAGLFMQNMQVLATGQEFRDVRTDNAASEKMVRPGDVQGAEKANFDTVTLLVSVQQAAKLLVGQKMGSYRVALRGAKDNSPIDMVAVRSGDLLPASTKGRDAGVEFIIGGKSGGADAVSVRQLRVPVTVAAQGATPPPPAIARDIEQALRQMGAPRPSRNSIDGGAPPSNAQPATAVR